jgi:hypothetical protein
VYVLPLPALSGTVVPLLAPIAPFPAIPALPPFTALAMGGEAGYLALPLVLLVLTTGGCVASIRGRPAGYDPLYFSASAAPGAMMQEGATQQRGDPPRGRPRTKLWAFLLGTGAWTAARRRGHILDANGVLLVDSRGLLKWIRAFGAPFAKYRGPPEEETASSGPTWWWQCAAAQGSVHYVLIDLVATAIVAGVRGPVVLRASLIGSEDLSSTAACDAAVLVALVVNLLLMLTAAALRPFISPLRNVFLVLTNLLLCASSALLLTSRRSRSAFLLILSTKAAEATTLISAILSGLLLAVRIYRIVESSCRDRGKRTGGRGGVDDVVGAAPPLLNAADFALFDATGDVELVATVRGGDIDEDDAHGDDARVNADVQPVAAPFEALVDELPHHVRNTVGAPPAAATAGGVRVVNRNLTFSEQQKRTRELQSLLDAKPLLLRDDDDGLDFLNDQHGPTPTAQGGVAAAAAPRRAHHPYQAAPHVTDDSL